MERERPPRPRRQPEVVRTSIEVGAFAVIVIVLLAVLGVVLHAGRGESAPPPDTVVVTQSQDFATLDPALAQTADAWELEYATCAKLLDYPPRSGYRGTRLVPEVAAALPTISPDRLTYAFHLRPGWRLSDGSPVTAASFARALERARSAELVSPADTYLREVRSWHASGLTLTIHHKQSARGYVRVPIRASPSAGGVWIMYWAWFMSKICSCNAWWVSLLRYRRPCKNPYL